MHPYLNKNSYMLAIIEKAFNLKQTPLEIFIQENSQLSSSDREILTHWQNNVIGLFEIKEIQEDSYQLMNWLTEKTYQVFRYSKMSEKEISRWQPGEIILTIIQKILTVEIRKLCLV